MTPHRLLSLVLAASTVVIALAPTKAVAAATPQPQAKRFKIALQVEQGDAKVGAEATADAGAEAKLALKSNAHEHDVRVTVTELADDALELELSYRRDGKVVIKSKTVAVTPGQPQKVRVRNTTLTFSLSAARTGHVPIDMPEGNDPLAGLD